MADYTNNAQQRILKIVMVMAGHEVTGLAPGEIAKSINITASNVTRDLFNLKESGIAEEIQETNRWRLSPKLPQIGIAMLNSISRAQSKVDEVKQRYTRDPI